jgi:predicted regulator of Ras-like GTPase activity (Roadblock/LC7/MglB family)
VDSDYRGEIRGFLLVTCFIIVVPLIFFPKDLGLKLNWPTLLLLALELAWYAVVLLIMFSRETRSRVLPLALVTLGYRIGLGAGFGILLLAMFSLPLSTAFSLGIHQYAPVFLLQALMAPFVLRPLLEVFLRNRRAIRSTKAASESEPAGALVSPSVSDVTRESPDDETTIISQKETKVVGKESLQGILHYLREYSGVKAAILVDHEGLVVGNDSSSGFDAEKVASFTRHLKETNDQVLSWMGERSVERIGIHTADAWICLNQIRDFTLVVLCDRSTDDLLSVRISQSTGMIRKYLDDRYQLNIEKAVEA